MPSDARVAEAPGRQRSVAIAVRDRNRSARSRFEMDGADQARAFLLGHGLSEGDANTV
ncbi:hypothetical protein ABZ465_18015 [Streptomyces griseoincarnatus]